MLDASDIVKPSVDFIARIKRYVFYSVVEVFKSFKDAAANLPYIYTGWTSKFEINLICL